MSKSKPKSKSDTNSERVSDPVAAALAVSYRDPASLKPHPRNTRTHSKAQIEQIAQSIRSFGFTNPILIDEQNEIIAGHGRLLGAKACSLTQVPVIQLSDLSEVQKRALRIADNKIALNAGWDRDLLVAELGEIQTMDLDFDLTLTGFETGEIDVLLDSVGQDEEPPVPDAAVVPRARLGDVFALGDHRLGCGDARDAGFLQQVMGQGHQISAAFMDPPYNVPINGFVNARGRHQEFAMASGEMSEAEFRSFLTETLSVAANASKNGAVHFVCMDWRHMDDLSHVGDAVYGDLLNLCVWNKSNAGMGSLYRSKHELVFVFRVGDKPHFNAVELGKHGRHRSNVWDYASVNTFQKSRAADLALHPTVKPIALVEDAIKDVTRRGERVLDLFTGSGTTLLAAERAGRQFVGLEIDPAYVDIAIERWEQMTGQIAKKLELADA